MQNIILKKRTNKSKFEDEKSSTLKKSFKLLENIKTIGYEYAM